MEDADNLKVYMDSISQYQLLSQEEEKRLALAAKAGDSEAKTKLINANLRLVVKIAHDFKRRGLSLNDLIAEGNVGLMKAVNMFDPSKGAKLSSYAAWWIKQSMRRAILNQTHLVRVPLQNQQKSMKVVAERRRLSAELGRTPTEEEIAESLNLTPRMVANARNGIITTIYLEAQIGKDSDGTYADIIPDSTADSPEEIVIGDELSTGLLDVSATLDSRERQILTMRFGLDGRPPMTLEQVSAAIGRTRERVRQLQNNALKKLREKLSE